MATPLEWSEVRPGLHPKQFTISNVRDRFAEKGDLFRGVLEHAALRLRVEPHGDLAEAHAADEDFGDLFVHSIYGADVAEGRDNTRTDCQTVGAACVSGRSAWLSSPRAEAWTSVSGYAR